jgi:hypothetical protein
MASKLKSNVLYGPMSPEGLRQPNDLNARFPVETVSLLLALSVIATGVTLGRAFGWAWGLAGAFGAVATISAALVLFACMASGADRSD